MIRQQVNLLAPMFRKQRALFSARISLAICAVVSLALALIYAGTAWRGAALAGEQARLLQQRDTITRRLNDLVAQIEGGQDKSLDAQIASLTQERDRKLQALAALSRRELGNTTGFSPQFTGLASQRLNGLWLTQVQISGQHMKLSGVALGEELIPRYLHKLGAEAVFAGTEFGHAQLQRVIEGGNEIRFELRTGSATP
ncbi:MAG TPA: PilN domain-containing protein [Verrucomicrobiae bacterium]|nr:PilN domain-containing protein [Verrucomicrobiae bacterium]